MKALVTGSVGIDDFRVGMQLLDRDDQEHGAHRSVESHLSHQLPRTYGALAA